MCSSGRLSRCGRIKLRCVVKRFLARGNRSNFLHFQAISSGYHLDNVMFKTNIIIFRKASLPVIRFICQSFSKSYMLHETMVLGIWFPVALCFACTLPTHLHCDDSYSSLMRLMDSKLGKDAYNPQLRPLLNQSYVLDVLVSFTIMSIVEVNDVFQRFTVNAMMTMVWKDELLRWNASDYGGKSVIYPHPTSIWRPRMFLSNTLGERDPFEDKQSELYVNSNGFAVWLPGSVLSTSCTLDVTKYPFDQQVCSLLFCVMSYHTDEVMCKVLFKIYYGFFTPNESWDVISDHVGVNNISASADGAEGDRSKSCPVFEFTLKRRSVYYVVNVVLPIVLLTFLNSFIFLIPVASGEKISFGITILLALALFLSTISAMMPKSASKTPHITIYIFSQLVSAVIVVIVSIATVVLQFLAESREDHLKSQANYSKLLSKLKAVVAFSSTVNGDCHHGDDDEGASADDKVAPKEMPTNRYRAISHHIDKICFIVSMISWITFTTYFFHSVLS